MPLDLSPLAEAMVAEAETPTDSGDEAADDGSQAPGSAAAAAAEAEPAEPAAAAV